ncbi:MAG: 2-oxoglutarate ferredoxin oxidoreductase subunit alpha [Deltaproteobacteria bacterium]|jgi:2-oxoglutarate ferredoxin oxidoreductase subunit alpha|nr:2-oxoglutarate ferredoxin oxidoreductase subunit alpha [Deltaproteobacteria bacterium]
MRKVFDTGNAAITEAAILAGLNFYSGYPITPATEIAENMSRRLPMAGGYYLQAEDETAAFHMAVGAAMGGMRAMTSTSGPGYVLYADPYGWAIGSEIPVVILNAQRVGPVSGITGAPGQGEFYLSRYPTHGGNFETIVLAPEGVRDAFELTIEAFRLAERFRTPVTVLADQLVTDGWEAFEVPEDAFELERLGLPLPKRKAHQGPDFYPRSDGIDIPPVVLGRGTGGACSDWTPTEEGYDTEEIEAQMKHSYRLIYKIRNNRQLIDRSVLTRMEDDPPVVLVSYGSPSRVVRKAVKEGRAKGLRVGAISLKSLWPFQDALFKKDKIHLVVELNHDGQLVREVQRASGGRVHFLGRCGELPTVSELLEIARSLFGGGRPRPIKNVREAW